MTEDIRLVRCPSCGAKNRVPLSRIHDRPRCGRCHEPLAPAPAAARPVDVSDRTFQEEVLSHPVGVLVDCWAPWCGPCRMVAPVLDQLARDYEGRVRIAKLNVDENPVTASRFQIRSIPTLLFFKKGTLVHRVEGALPRQEIERCLEMIC